MSNSPELLEEQRGDVLWLTIQREERRNAMNATVLNGIGAAITRVNQTREARAIVITGAGSKAFCAGADLKAGGSTFDAGQREAEREADRKRNEGNSERVSNALATNVECVVWVSRVQLEFARASFDRFKHHFWVKAHTVVGDFCSGFGKQVTGFWQQKIHSVLRQNAQ